MSDLVNTSLGQYQLIEAVGHGGMATVYKAYQPSLDRHVAVKVLLSNRDPQFAARFKREARAIAALQHHNILPIYDYGEQNGVLYFVTQYVENGVSLHDLLGKPVPPGQALRLIGHVLAALDYAHSRGVVHRDIKPANILMPSPNWALLADFGIAKLMNDSQHLTMTGFIIGTAAYMAPEQAAGRTIDARTDLYSLGVVMYEMLTGRVPFESDTPMAVLTKHVYEPPPPPRSLNPNLPTEIEAVLLRVLAKDPGQRYQSAADMAADIERVTPQFERPRPPSQVTSLYQSGVDAFQKGRWDEAVERFGRLVTLAPEFEDAGMLLNAARLAQQQSTSSFGRPKTEPTPPPTPEKTAPPRPLPPPPEADRLPQRITSDAAPVAAAQDGAPPRRRIPIWALIAIPLILIFGAGGVYAISRGTGGDPAVAPIITPSATATKTPASTQTPSQIPSPSPTQTPSQTPKPSATPTATSTNTPEPTATTKPTAKPTIKPTPRPKPTATLEPPTPEPPPPPTPEPPPPPTPEPPTPTNTPKQDSGGGGGKPPKPPSTKTPRR